MRRYETIFVADPGLPDEDVEALHGVFADAITGRNGAVLKVENWGKRKLAYEVRKQREGHYLLLEYSCPDASLPHEIERRLRLHEKVFKFLTVRIDNDKKRLAWEVKQAEKEKERAARREAERHLEDRKPSPGAAPAAPVPAAPPSHPVEEVET
ncbi:MAG: 30S ribosomal protein S6 [Acidobacteriota bacterium]